MPLFNQIDPGYDTILHLLNLKCDSLQSMKKETRKFIKNITTMIKWNLFFMILFNYIIILRAILNYHGIIITISL